MTQENELYQRSGADDPFINSYSFIEIEAPEALCVQVRLEIGHKASIRAKPTAEGFTHDWTVFVRGPEGCNVQHFVERVVFQLHESFPKPKRVVKEPPYQVSESGYAGFILPIEVFFKNKEEPKKVLYNYDLYLQLEGAPINPARVEKLTFNNPTDDFRRKLIRAGGVGVLASEGGTILNQPQPIPSKTSPAHSPHSNPGSSALISSGTYKKQISEAIKAPKSSTGQATGIHSTDSVASQPTISSSSPSSSSSAPASPNVVSATVPLPSVSVKEVVQRSAAAHLHVPTSFVDLFGQPIKTSRNRSPDPSKIQKDFHYKSSSSSSSLSKSLSKPSLSTSALTSKETVGSSVRSGSSSSKEPKSSKSLVTTTITTATSSAAASASKTKEGKGREKSIAGKRPPSPAPPAPTPIKALDSEKKKKHSESSRSPPRPSGSSTTRDLKVKKGVTVKDKDRKAEKVKRGIVDNYNDDESVSLKSRKEKRPIEDKGKSKDRQPKSIKKLKSEPRSSFPLLSSAGEQRIINPPRTPPATRSPPPEITDVADASPTSSISFSSLPGAHGGHRGGTGPLGALMAELVDEDDFLSPLSSDPGSPLEAELSCSPPRQTEKRPPSPPFPPPPPPPSINEKRKFKEKKKNDLKATKKFLSESSKKSSSSSSFIVKGKTSDVADEEPISSNVAITDTSVVSTTDDDAVLITGDYIVELKELQERIMAIKDRGDLQKIVNVIEETGLYHVTSTTFDFDLCTLDRVTVKKLQTCLALSTT